MRLKTVRLGYNGLSGDGVAAVADALLSNNVLTDLDLTCNRIDDIGLARLAEALGSNETLTHIRVSICSSYTRILAIIHTRTNNLIPRLRRSPVKCCQ